MENIKKNLKNAKFFLKEHKKTIKNDKNEGFKDFLNSLKKYVKKYEKIVFVSYNLLYKL